MKNYFLLCCAIYWHLLSFGQFTIKGIVVDEEHQPLPYANIVLENTYNGCYSDANGSFVLKNIKKGNYSLKVSYVGYQTYIEKINLITDLDLTIILKRSPYVADEIIVQATRSDKTFAGSITLLDRKKITETINEKDVPFLISYTPSVITTSDAGMGIGYTGISIRGSDVRRINVTINDVPLNDAESHGVWWVDLPDIISSTDNIQIQRGVGSSTNGAGAFGASINMQTLSLNKDPMTEIHVGGGSYNTSRFMVNSSTGLLNNHWVYDLRLSKIYSDGFIDRAFSNLKSYYFAGGYYAEKTMIKFINFSGFEKTYQAWNGVFKARYENNRSGIDSLFNHGFISNSEYLTLLNSNNQRANIYSYDNQTDNYWQSHYQLHCSYEMNLQFASHLALHYTRGKGYYESYRESKKYSKYGLNPVIIGNDTLRRTDFIDQKWLDNHFYGVVGSLNYHKNKILSTFGFAANRYEGKHYGDIIWAKVVPDTMAKTDNKKFRWYNGTGDKKDVSGFVKMNYQLFSNIFVFGDVQLRYIDYIIKGIDDDLRDISQKHSYIFFNPKAGLKYDINTFNNLFANVAVAHREPERSNFTDADSGKVPNPERLIDYELAYRYQKDNYLFGVNLYYMDYYDQLVMTGEVNNVGTPIMTNVKRSYRTGIEFEAAIRLLNNMDWSFNATFSKNKIKQFIAYYDDWDNGSQIVDTLNNTTISFSPEQILSNVVSYTLFSKLKLTLQSKYVGKQYLDNTQDEKTKLDDYLVHNFLITYKFSTKWAKEVNLDFALYNLSNKVYVSNGWSYKYRFYGVDNYAIAYFPQAPLHYMINLKIKF